MINPWSVGIFKQRTSTSVRITRDRGGGQGTNSFGALALVIDFS